MTKARNPFENKISLVEMANNILQKKELNRIERENNSKIKAKVYKSNKAKNSIKLVKSNEDGIIYFIPENMRIRGFKSRIDKNLENIREFEANVKSSIIVI